MKKYTSPSIEMENKTDVILASPGTETSPMPDSDGIWDLNV